MDEGHKYFALRVVNDWRCREGKWNRRCRIVAREYRGTEASTSETFSLTSTGAATKLFLLLHLLYGWKLTVLDIKNAYLMVARTETVLIRNQ